MNFVDDSMDPTLAETLVTRRLLTEPTPTPGSPEWNAQRLTGLGGSDIAVAAGLSKYKTPYRLWEERTGRATPDDISDVEAVRLGNRLEDACAEEYEDRTGFTLRRVRQTLRLAEQPWMMAHLDRRVVGQPRGVDLKTAGLTSPAPQGWGEEGTPNAPTVYIAQVQWYMGITGWSAFDIAALIGGRGFRIFPIDRDEEFIALLIRAGEQFMHAVKTDTPPKAQSLDDVKRRFPTSLHESFTYATDQILGYDEAMRDVEARLKELEATREMYEIKIKEFMGDSEALAHPTLKDKNGPVRLRTWKSQSTVRINLDRVKARLASDISDFQEVSTTRVFRACKLP